MKVFAKFKLSQSQVNEILEQLKGSKSEMENCFDDRALTCYELFHVKENSNVEISYWMRILRIDNDNFELQFISEVKTSF